MDSSPGVGLGLLGLWQPRPTGVGNSRGTKTLLAELGKRVILPVPALTTVFRFYFNTFVFCGGLSKSMIKQHPRKWGVWAGVSHTLAVLTWLCSPGCDMVTTVVLVALAAGVSRDPACRAWGMGQGLGYGTEPSVWDRT